MKKLKISLIALAINLLVFGGTAYASFPAKKERAAEQTTTVTDKVAPTATNATIQAQDKTPDTVVSAADAAGRGNDDMWITLALWFFLGGFAAHRWYKKKPIGWNILYIITLGGCGIWAIIDLINILTDNF
ncbi:MAG: TM2 domain-containing protein [Bacteroidota bacterium]